MPKVSAIIASYDVALWLPEFLDSLDAQTDGLADHELIFVNDGSTDNTAELIEAWIARSGVTAQLINKSNGGASSARNLGLAVARGEWVTFWDPDDMLTPAYTAEARDFLASPQADEVALVVAKMFWYNESSGKRQNHPLNYRFADGDRVADLEAEPRMIHLATNSAWYRREVMAERGLEFDERVVPTFEDGHLTARYLGGFDRPKVAFRGGAHYLYRRRADQSSLVQTGWSKPTKYVEQPRHGWLDMLGELKERYGYVPHWAQHMVLYELQWYFRFEQSVPNRTSWVPTELGDQFHGLLAEVCEYLDEDYIQTFANSTGGFNLDLAAVLLFGIKSLAGPGHVTVDRLEPARRVARLRYYYGVSAPVEQIRVNGVLVDPVRAKTRRIDFIGRTLAHERIVWFRATDGLSVELDGATMPVQLGEVRVGQYEAEAEALWTTLAGRRPPGSGGSSTAAGATTRARRLAQSVAHDYRRALRVVPVGSRLVLDRATREVAKAPALRKMFADAWLLMDRNTAAQDNAEHLYRYLRAEHPKINAWFVLDRDSVDWPRLAAEGFRMLEHGSARHRAALLNTRHMISSHADDYVTRPLDPKRFPKPKFDFTFLQHGIIKDDLATWLNPKPIDLFLTSTTAEYESIAGTGNRYRYTPLETALTGLPRHDRLRRLGLAAGPDQRKTLLFMPTWRWHLLGQRTKGGNARVRISGFWETGFMRSWRALLESDRLRKAAEAHGVKLKMVLHPNMEEYAAESPLPADIAVSRFADIDIQELLAGAVALVTDFSSLAFDAAYIDRPVVHYQFDADEFYNNHVYTRGYWDYPEHGLGPICPDSESALDAIIALLENGGVPEPLYAERIAQTFDFRDGRCCERVVQRILALEKPLSEAELYRGV